MGTRHSLTAALILVSSTAMGSGGKGLLPCENDYPTEPGYRLSIVTSGQSNYLASDGREYVHDRAGCMNVTDDPRGFLHFAYPNGKYWPDCRITPNRSFRVDLSHPVPGGGGVSRGVITDERPHIQVFTKLNASGKAVGMQGMAIGETTNAMYIAIAATSHQLRLYFNPTNACPSWITRAPGSTFGTVTRTSATHWEVEIPEGSIGRLIEGPDGGNHDDRGLYYFRAHFTIDALAASPSDR